VITTAVWKFAQWRPVSFFIIYMLQIFVTKSYTEFHKNVTTGWVADSTSQTEKQTDGCGLHIIFLRIFLSYGKVTVGKELRLPSGNIYPKCDTAGILWWLLTFREDMLPLPLMMDRPGSNSIYEIVLFQMMIDQLDKKYISSYAVVTLITQDIWH
jgi:hypothetical protein